MGDTKHSSEDQEKRRVVDVFEATVRALAPGSVVSDTHRDFHVRSALQLPLEGALDPGVWGAIRNEQSRAAATRYVENQESRQAMAKKKAGRKKAAAGTRREVNVPVRFTKAEAERLRAACVADGNRPMSAFVRNAALAAIKNAATRS